METQNQSCLPCSSPSSACSELTDFTIPGLPTPGPFPECQQQFPGRPGDSSLRPAQGNPMPWCQQRVSLGVWGMGLRLCRSELSGWEEAVITLPPWSLFLPYSVRTAVPSACTRGPWQRPLSSSAGPKLKVTHTWKTVPGGYQCLALNQPGPF